MPWYAPKIFNSTNKRILRVCSTWFEASQGSVWLLLCCYTVGTGILLLQARWSLQCEAGGLDSSAVSSGRQGQSSWHRALQARLGWGWAGSGLCSHPEPAASSGLHSATSLGIPVHRGERLQRATNKHWISLVYLPWSLRNQYKGHFILPLVLVSEFHWSFPDTWKCFWVFLVFFL